jgi:hypothetical protein
MKVHAGLMALCKNMREPIRACNCFLEMDLLEK